MYRALNAVYCSREESRQVTSCLIAAHALVGRVQAIEGRLAPPLRAQRMLKVEHRIIAYSVIRLLVGAAGETVAVRVERRHGQR